MSDTPRKLTTDESVTAGQKAYDVNEFKDSTTPTTFDACRQVRVNADGEYKFYYAGRPDTAITMAVTKGEYINHSFVKITATNDALITTGKLTVIY